MTSSDAFIEPVAKSMDLPISEEDLPASDEAGKTAFELPTTVYTPESPLRQPLTLLGDMVRDLLASRELAWRLYVRDNGHATATACSAMSGFSSRRWWQAYPSSF